MDDLQEEIVAHILSRIPIKTIFHCRCVCKSWRNILSGSYFVDLHLSRSPAALIIIQSTGREINILKVGELDDKIDHHDIYYDPLMRFDLGLDLNNRMLSLIGTVNGLVCLCNYYPEVAAYICNPITREYIFLPDYDKKLHSVATHCFGIVEGKNHGRKVSIVAHGFGYVEASNEYKVVSLYIERNYKTECKIYTLGTGMWRSLGHIPFSVIGGQGGVFVSGNLHWLTNDQDTPDKVVGTFDLDKELFQQIASPPLVDARVNYRSLGSLGGCLCICDNTAKSELAIWVMREYGMKESWIKQIVIQHKPTMLLSQKVLPLKVLKDGTILMVCYDAFFVTYHPENETLQFCEGGDAYRFDAMVYVPGFIRLQSFMLENVSVSLVS